MANRKCMKGYTMNSHGSCVEIRRKKTAKIKSKRNGVNRVLTSDYKITTNDRAALPCCVSGCDEPTVFRWHCMLVDGGWGQINTLVGDIPYTVGGAVGCVFTKSEEEIINDEAYYLTVIRGNACPSDPYMGGQEVTAGLMNLPVGQDFGYGAWRCSDTSANGYCEMESTTTLATSYCSGFWTFDDIYLGEFSGERISEYNCGNTTVILPPAAPPKTEFSRGGIIKRRGIK